MSLRIAALVLAGLAAAGCTAGGGADPIAASGPVGPVVVGTAARLPGGGVTVSAVGGIRPGTVASLRLQLAAADATVQRVEIGYSADHRSPPAMVTAVANGSGQYEAEIPIPAELSDGSRLVARITDAQGNRMESGVFDLRLR